MRDCAMFDLPDVEWGERPATAVVAEPGQEPTTDKARPYTRGRLRG
ncbi:hypothetical protein AB0C21_41900 [Spirillospora sp. NPDC049024]